MDADTINAAYIVMGEASTCPALAMLAVYWMLQRSAGPFYGWQTPSDDVLRLVAWADQMPDPHPSARFVFSAQDLQQARVRAIVGNRRPLARYRCAGGLSLTFYE
jgi:hypothetical protein